ncbi:uncharacterized protein EURHEDRAFT_121264 [Aspergillus ruber CBS 135680]|uniref:Uncharacterized protein n=1 Tax=Aspergillus ruber (strain CBS 135680) TaxID=1388766 RepID=A0A017SRR9_ASPRC|nr:uncharacterized protein EURHEDRAFT_121264 [Aspergillus ruber CBS 135680]EYE98970.1 hypothetical protein EURHEDRAFT_121264 [Aspergillus ruber CBS 135680]
MDAYLFALSGVGISGLFDFLFSFVVYLQGCFRFGDLAGGLYLSVHITLPYRPDS